MTGDGMMVFKDGLTANTVQSEWFREWTNELDVTVEIVEVDRSRVFCNIGKRGHDTNY